MPQISTNQALLEQAENIEDLHARLGGHRKAQQDRPHLEAESKQLWFECSSCYALYDHIYFIAQAKLTFLPV
ncbi:hypothetical protein [Dasania marina]|uniref:hypothetical protein n=1 Tax=Dasania marina TaxID=471499 RepID=UPI0030DAAF9E|tara:strand:+ start:21971 stop:22186 length:216 start_codon:yes stop_codon:yes gene_type:complete